MTPPRVVKVDPPCWWAGHTLDPVRLLIRGAGLSGARVSSKAAGLTFGKPKASASGRYLSVDVRISPKAAAGKRTFELVTAAGSASASFEVLKPLKDKGRRSFGPDDVIYLVMPDRFARGGKPHESALVDRALPRSYHGGNLRGVIERLPYIKDLGATALWLTPLYANTDRPHPPNSWSSVPFSDYHGYGPVDHYAMDPHFGDFADLSELAARCRALGLKLIIDQVSNHTSQNHPWTQEPPTPTWYHGEVPRHRDNPYQPWVLADPHASPELLSHSLDGWFGGILPDLNQDDPEMARYMIQNVLWWLGMSRADGMRHDVVSFVPRTFWRACFAAVKRQYPGFRAVGEVNGDQPATVSYFQGGRKGFDGVDTGLDTVFDFPLRKAIREVFLERKPAERLAAVLSEDRLYPDPSLLVTCFGLHDDSRFMGQPGADIASIQLAFAFVLTTRGIPLIYYGDELAMAGGEDPDNRRDFPGGWPGDPRDAFTAAGRTGAENAVFEHARRLLALRARSAALRRGRLVNLAAGPRVYAYARLLGRSWAVVVINNGDGPEKVEFDAGLLKPAAGALEDRLGGSTAFVTAGRFSAELAARTAAVYLDD